MDPLERATYRPLPPMGRSPAGDGPLLRVSAAVRVPDPQPGHRRDGGPRQAAVPRRPPPASPEAKPRSPACLRPWVRNVWMRALIGSLSYSAAPFTRRDSLSGLEVWAVGTGSGRPEVRTREAKSPSAGRRRPRRRLRRSRATSPRRASRPPPVSQTVLMGWSWPSAMDAVVSRQVSMTRRRRRRSCREGLFHLSPPDRHARVPQCLRRRYLGFSMWTNVRRQREAATIGGSARANAGLLDVEGTRRHRRPAAGRGSRPG